MYRTLIFNWIHDQLSTVTEINGESVKIIFLGERVSINASTSPNQVEVSFNLIGSVRADNTRNTIERSGVINILVDVPVFSGVKASNAIVSGLDEIFTNDSFTIGTLSTVYVLPGSDQVIRGETDRFLSVRVSYPFRFFDRSRLEPTA